MNLDITLTVWVWIKGSDFENEGQWDDESGRPLEFISWTDIEPNGDVFEQCLFLSEQGMGDVDCELPMKIACSVEGKSTHPSPKQ